MADLQQKVLHLKNASWSASLIQLREIQRIWPAYKKVAPPSWNQKLMLIKAFFFYNAETQRAVNLPHLAIWRLVAQSLASRNRLIAMTNNDVKQPTL